ncbi:MAG: CmcI family methyltransferase, partial [bacterium]|nr:CmcI family methyltransferase [bacterium]
LSGSSTDDNIVKQIKYEAQRAKRVLVILDSDHSQAHVARELEIYAALVTKDSYVIVEDSNINGHPVYQEFGPGPYEALHAFLKNNSHFAIDKTLEKFFVSFNTDGYLKRIS